MRLLAIDPGLQGTGIAIFKMGVPRPRHVTVLKPRAGKYKDWPDRVDDLVMQIRDLAINSGVTHVISEMMEMHQSPRAMMMWKTGDLQRTVFLVGALYGCLMSAHDDITLEFKLTTPSEWKGQLPKSVTINRINKLLGKGVGQELGIETHAWDAVGIGLWHMGFLK